MPFVFAAMEDRGAVCKWRDARVLVWGRSVGDVESGSMSSDNRAVRSWDAVARSMEDEEGLGVQTDVIGAACTGAVWINSCV